MTTVTTPQERKFQYMAEKKKTVSAAPTKGTQNRQKSAPSSKTLGSDIIESKNHSTKPMKMPPNPDSPANQILLCAIALVGVLLLACLLLTDTELKTKGLTGPVGYYISLVFYGIFGIGAYALPVVTVIYAAMWKHSLRQGKIRSKAVLSFLFVLLVSAAVHMAFASFNGSLASDIPFYSVKALWNSGIMMQSGGILGGFVGGLLKTCLNVIAWPVLVLVILAVIMFMFEITPNMIAYCIRQMAESSGEKRNEKAEQRKLDRAARDEEKRAQKELEEEEKRLRRLQKQQELAEREQRFYEEHKRKKVTDIPLDEQPKNTKEDVKKDKPKEDKVPAVYDISGNGDLDGGDNDDNIVPEIETKREKIGHEKDIKRPQAEKDGEVPKRTVKDVDINEIFDEKKKKPAYITGDIHGNEQRDLDEGDSYDMDIDTDKKREQEIEKLVDDLDDWLPEIEKKTAEKADDTPKDDVPVRTKRAKVIPEIDVKDELPPDDEKEEEKPKYVLPPITLLEKGSDDIDTGISDEVLRKNGERLVETLRSFRVDVEMSHISKGPTITRYELTPKAGVRVRSIANLVDDIALALETQGIRIEAPIPGKAAVGIEVPNKNLSTVYLRSLIDTDAFKNHKSKINCCLGKNVSGEPVFLDIAKMPHLLIAGATGMGKSVCINSLLISLLYKATPDEVKLILIDPKKVELNVYNKLPHLLVPVVNQPKMAAGSLAWAVSEMERRFELIEEVGVRDIAGYNKVTAIDPQKEFLPQIVIIIDELADLMMTAPDDVEQSIIRLAQKARAAGMHLIIGTQRPSVDVITGLIKANVPSRIAFTVASNIDSRTIIDVAGAEKLIGRGDMLYAPVGAMKPIRVQGSFVSDGEVERVTDFIKAQIKGDYDSDIIAEIDKNAKQCGQKKKSADIQESDSADSGDLDDKFYEAVDVALDEGKISTSLLQRRISIGYGRAAKIIDTMQKMGIVSKPDGQKPRNTLITRSDWDEMLMRMDGKSGTMSEPDDSNSPLDGDDEFDDDAPF